ncbi:MAG TPA: AAA family ATPase, partial [Actinoplanes sp.]|nr:AAA family ATPase [Actinoplanes sp.]
MLYGRARAVATVADALAQARAGHGGLLLATGEAGIGKTALAGGLLRTAPADGVLVAWAACGPDAGAPPYWPWLQVLRGLAPEPTAGASSPFGDPFRTGMTGSTDATGAERFRLFEQIANHLVRAGANQPVVAVLDDLHWSDEPSLLALAHVTGRIRTARVLLLGTYREADARPALLDVARAAQVIQLAGLDQPDVAALMAEITGTAPDPRLAAEVWQRTGGNPFFVREVTRLLMVHGSDARPADVVPAGVREVLRQRLARLSADCTHLLGAAAVLGTEPALDTVGEVAGMEPTEAISVVEEAVRAAVVVRPPAPAGRIRFRHELFRAAVYEALGPAVRTAHHRLAAEALRRQRATGRDVPAAEVAAHFLRAGAASAADAVRYSVLAGHAALERLAYEDAHGHFERALSALAGVAGDTRPVRLDLLLHLGAAQHRSGRPDEARTSFHAAAAAARTGGDASALAAAALGLHRLGTRTALLDAEVYSLLGEAADAVAAEAGEPALPDLLADLLAAQARTLHHGRMDAAPAGVTALAERAVRLARAGGDPATIATSLLALHDARWAPGSARTRLPILAEMAECARRCGDRERYAQARQLRAAALIELGEPAGVAELAAYCRLADDLGHPGARWNAVTRRATLALITGDLDEAAALVREGARLGTEIGEPDALGVANTQASVLALFGRPMTDLRQPDTLFGRTDEPLLAALLHHAEGDRRAAAAATARLATPPWQDLEGQVFEAILLIEYGGDAARRDAYDRLRPLSGLHCVVGGCASYQGPVEYHRAALAAALGRLDEATAAAAAAVAACERLGAPAWQGLARDLTTRP